MKFLWGILNVLVKQGYFQGKGQVQSEQDNQNQEYPQKTGASRLVTLASMLMLILSSVDITCVVSSLCLVQKKKVYIIVTVF